MATALSEDDIKRHAFALMVAIDIYPQITREMIVNTYPPKIVSMIIQNEVNQTFMANLTKTENRLVSQMYTNGYTSLDLSFLYKMIRHFSLIQPPTLGWGQKPRPWDQSEGDDIERMERNRNDIYHRSSGEFKESDINDFFQQSIEIAKRMDKRIGSPTNGFESKIQNIVRLSQKVDVEGMTENLADNQEDDKQHVLPTKSTFSKQLDSFQREGHVSLIQLVNQRVVTCEEALDLPGKKSHLDQQNLADEDDKKQILPTKSTFARQIYSFQREGHVSAGQWVNHGVVTCEEALDLPDKKSNLDQQNLAAGSLLTTVIECDGHVIDCDMPRYLLDLNNLYGKATKDTSQLKTTKAITKLLSLHKGGAKNTDMETEFKNSILLNESLVCRYILANCQNHADYIEMVKNGLHLAMENGKTNCAKPIAWEICRRYARTVSITQYYDIWPGFECGCITNNSSDDIFFCSCNVVIIAEVHNMEKLSHKSDSFYGISIMYKEVNGHSQEAMSVIEKIDSTDDATRSYENYQDVSSENATKYFAKHSKLTMISKSHLKSKEFGRKKQKFERVPCIQLFCRAKGIIPIGESHFPDIVGSLQTDIFEGYPRLHSKPITLGTEFVVPTEEHNNRGHDQNAAGGPINDDEVMDIDNDVGRSCKGKSGTIGGFLKFHGEEAFLTCAHVIFPMEFLLSRPFGSEIHEQGVKIYCVEHVEGNSLKTVFPGGHLASFTFPRNEIDGVSIDAAIIRIDKNHARINLNDADNQDLKSKYLQNCCLDWKKARDNKDFEVRAFGAISLQQHIKDRPEYFDSKFLMSEKLSESVSKVHLSLRPSNVQDNIHFYVRAVDILSERYFHCPPGIDFHNQIAMHKIRFSQGDSGMCIYVREDGKLWCLGMAIASHPAGGCIITPLEAILRHFNY